MSRCNSHIDNSIDHNTNMSYWLLNLDPCHEQIGDTSELNTEVQDVVIIGGGVTGCSVAYHYANTSSRVILLEKGDISCGATGCNGGIISPGTSESFSSSVDRYGLDITRELYQYSVDCTEAIKDFVKQTGTSCELRFNGSVSLAFTEEEVLNLRKSHDELLSYDIPVEWWDAAMCEEKTLSRSFLGGMFKPHSGNLWAAKLVHAIADQARKRGTIIHTHTEVTGVCNSSDVDGIIIVNTSRGDIQCRNVVYATNAWTRHLLPHFSETLIPVRNQVIITAPLPHMWDFSMGANYGFEYFMQRPDGRIVLGGMRNLTPTGEINSDDTTNLNPDVSSALRTYLPKHFPSIPASVEIEHEWIGVMCFSPDRNPLIGPLGKDKPGQYIAAGYTGHGMPFAFMAGKNIADMIRGVKPSPYVERAFDPSRFTSN